MQKTLAAITQPFLRRRDTLTCLIWLIAFGSASAQNADNPATYRFQATVSPIDRPARAHTSSSTYKGAIADALVHIDPGYNPELMQEALQSEGVRFAVAMPVPNEGLGHRTADGTMQKIRMAQSLAPNLRAMCAGDYMSNWLHDAEKGFTLPSTIELRFKRLESDLDSGWCLGIGELGLLHFNKSGQQNVIESRFDAPLMLRMVDIVGQRNAWIQLHAEPREPNGRSHASEVWEALSLWTKRQPTLKIMLSHTGMTSAADARKILEIYPQVYMSIKLMNSKNNVWSHLEPLQNAGGELYEDWAALMEAMPERFVVGSDVKFGQAHHDSGEKYDRLIGKFRRMLGSLHPEASRLIALENVRRLYGFKSD
jgi:hypothetical protein